MLLSLQVEKDLCAATAHFEDFVLQFLDRCVNDSYVASILLSSYNGLGIFFLRLPFDLNSGCCCCCCRCFALIDSSTLEQTRDETETDTQTHLESLVELGLSSTVSTVLTQCSTEIYKVKLQSPRTHAHTLQSLSISWLILKLGRSALLTSDAWEKLTFPGLACAFAQLSRHNDVIILGTYWTI